MTDGSLFLEYVSNWAVRFSSDVGGKLKKKEKKKETDFNVSNLNC
jgi:hypothetical protein